MTCKCKKYQCGAPAKVQVLVNGTFIPLCKFCMKKCYSAYTPQSLNTPTATTDSSFTPTRGKRPLP